MADMPNPIEVQKHLKGMDYPVSKDTILSTAKDSGADQAILDALGNIPDREYDGPNAISHELSANNG
ncbi:DUF2795 domain-containing protein [Amnibacterium soli]|jgi:hypothetical protein|uniref:DUF2795 domain-containing protein n=1 Tax=Amnibacterium soli TaxID=1282736 RepID=A0ABP8YR52_9MICO